MLHPVGTGCNFDGAKIQKQSGIAKLFLFYFHVIVLTSRSASMHGATI